MTIQVKAIFENGVFRPLHPIEGLAEHSCVDFSVESPAPCENGIMSCLGIMPDDDAQEMMRIIEAEFEQVDPSEWK